MKLSITLQGTVVNAPPYEAEWPFSFPPAPHMKVTFKDAGGNIRTGTINSIAFDMRFGVIDVAVLV